jgi:hypothetical protein
MEISVEQNEASRVAAENASDSPLRVELISDTSENCKKYPYYRISKIVGGKLYADEAQQKPITEEYPITYVTGLVTTLWFVPNLCKGGPVSSFSVEQITMTGEVGASVTMTLNLPDPQLRGH